ncbi:hypothetical protein BKA65DRAFT_223415 [Rhexocercosporidium sp. MPI-PUGE-AT-0058]|nr:hypothetical protein BKA65DRAFT_223415 [Rhexocercosporidium sp. MPI-PUGE-AT-0058]
MGNSAFLSIMIWPSKCSRGKAISTPVFLLWTVATQHNLDLASKPCPAALNIMPHPSRMSVSPMLDLRRHLRNLLTRYMRRNFSAGSLGPQFVNSWMSVLLPLFVAYSSIVSPLNILDAGSAPRLKRRDTIDVLFTYIARLIGSSPFGLRASGLAP